AYERLKARAAQAPPEPAAERSGRQPQGILEAMAKSAARSIGSELGRRVLRGALGAILGGKRR
ncbi:MAG TPA: helicase HerA-like domain-containing protein, partial [Burkholderiales bacterium]|nr:helicase HerA-like domain-containing protein [Burkholderiales bacterium]